MKVTNQLTHLDKDGKADMVDISQKDTTDRVAVAVGQVRMAIETLTLIMSGNTKKGDVLGTARLAGIMAAKKTSELIPLCHQILLSRVSVDIQPDQSLPGLTVKATAKVAGKTGVEMEALTAVSITCLTIYDMAKAVDRGMKIENIKLIEKSGGKSGLWSLENKDSK